MYILRQFIIRVLRFMLAVTVEKNLWNVDGKVGDLNDPKARFREATFTRDTVVKALPYLILYIRMGLILVTVGVAYFCFKNPTETQKVKDGYLEIVLSIGVLWLMIQGLKFARLYYIREVTLYYDDYVLVGSYKYHDKLVTYEEIGEMVRKKGIRVRKGRLEIPIPGGITKIYIQGIDPSFDKSELINFLNEKSGIEIPKLSKEEQRFIALTGSLPLGFNTAIYVWLFDFAINFIFYMSERSTNTFFGVYFPGTIQEFLQTHIMFFVLATPFLLLGIIAEIINFVPFRVNISKYKIFKV